MKDEMIICPRCTSNACYHRAENEHHVFSCYGCGFMSDSTKERNTESVSEFEETLPELYKDLMYFDSESKLQFYPSVINIHDKGMVFADGSGVSTWKWAAVLAIPIEKKEQNKFPKEQTHKMDMKTIQHFDERDYMEALDYICYFHK
jgi:hypothetical protein